jgi:hypothetical protein
LFVYYESRKRDLKTRTIYECWCDERLKTKDEKSTLLGYTGKILLKIHLDKDEVNEYVFRLRTNCADKTKLKILVPGNVNHDSQTFFGTDKLGGVKCRFWSKPTHPEDD